jgi:hypothetical protein
MSTMTTMIKGHQLSRACRQPGFQPPETGQPVAAFMVQPTICGQAAVRLLHTTGSVAATQYLANSNVGTWTHHSYASLASNAQAVIDGFAWYVQCDAADGRPMLALDRHAVITQLGRPVDARLDVVLTDGPDLAARIVMWDGPDFDPIVAPVIACSFALALAASYPGRSFTTIGVWQARADNLSPRCPTRRRSRKTLRRARYSRRCDYAASRARA